jgi:hypothetical protein
MVPYVGPMLNDVQDLRHSVSYAFHMGDVG